MRSLSTDEVLEHLRGLQNKTTTEYMTTNSTLESGVTPQPSSLTAVTMYWQPFLLAVLGVCLPLILLGACLGYLCHKKKSKRRADPNLPTFFGNSDYPDRSASNTPGKSLLDHDTSFFYANMIGNNNTLRRLAPPSCSTVVDSVRRGDLEQVYDMLTKKVNFKGLRDANGSPVLHMAIENLDLEMFKLLLEGVALNLVDVFERNNDGQSAIIFAASQGLVQLDYFIALVEAISRWRKLSSQYNYYSLRRDGPETGGPLAGESIEELALVDDAGRNCIHYAALNDLPQAIHFFSSSGADVDFLDFRGDTPLHLATRDGLDASVQALLDCGAIKVMKDRDGHDSVGIAEEKGFYETAAVLRNHSFGVYSSVQQARRQRRATLFTEWERPNDQIELNESPMMNVSSLVTHYTPTSNPSLTAYRMPRENMLRHCHSFTRSSHPRRQSSPSRLMSMLSQDPEPLLPAGMDPPDIGLDSDLTLPTMISENDSRSEALPARYRKYSKSENAESICGVSLSSRTPSILNRSALLSTFAPEQTQKS